jgi:hypothetical protein
MGCYTDVSEKLAVCILLSRSKQKVPVDFDIHSSICLKSVTIILIVLTSLARNFLLLLTSIKACLPKQLNPATVSYLYLA